MEIKINNITKSIDYILGQENEYNNYQDEQTYSYSEIPVESIMLNKDIITLEILQEEQLIVIINPENASNKNVIWICDNTNIATVDDDGLVAAISSGTANITVTSEYGNYTYNCTIIVN